MLIRKETRSDGWKRTTYFANKSEFNLVMTVLLNSGWELKEGSFYERVYMHKTARWNWEYKNCFVRLILLTEE